MKRGSSVRSRRWYQWFLRAADLKQSRRVKSISHRLSPSLRSKQRYLWSAWCRGARWLNQTASFCWHVMNVSFLTRPIRWTRALESSEISIQARPPENTRLKLKWLKYEILKYRVTTREEKREQREVKRAEEEERRRGEEEEKLSPRPGAVLMRSRLCDQNSSV